MPDLFQSGTGQMVAGHILLWATPPPDIRVTMVYTERVIAVPPDVRVTMVYTERVVKP